MRVCHVMTADLWAGAEVQLATTVSYLAERPDVSVRVVLFNGGRLARELRALGVDVAIVDESRRNAAQIVTSLARYLRRHRIDIVHTHRYKDTILGAAAAKLAGVRHVVRTMHGLREPLTGWNLVKCRGYELLEKAVLLLAADRVIAVSNRMATTLNGDGYPAAMVTAIHNGIDLRHLAAVRSRCEVRRELGIAEDAIVVGTAGRLSPVKGHEHFLRAARLILDREPAARVVVAGGGPLEDDLMALASQLRIGGACHFLGARADVHDLVAAMDVFVLPSLNEGMPMALLEAMALETPVVATDVGGVPEVVRDRQTGLLVPPGDAHGLAEACLQLARDRAWARQLASEARRLVEAEYSREHAGQALCDVYHTAGRSNRNHVSAIGLLLAFARKAGAYVARSVRHGIERRQVRGMRRSPSALVEALKAGKSILVVCHGNIIRSPFAAFLLAQSLGHQASVKIASAGLEALPGRPPHPTALRTAAAHRVDLSSHAASRLDRETVAGSDVIFVMDIPQLLELRQRFPEARRKTFLLATLAPETPLEVRDPIDGDESVFQACYEHITRAVRPVAGVLSPLQRT